MKLIACGVAAAAVLTACAHATTGNPIAVNGAPGTGVGQAGGTVTMTALAKQADDSTSQHTTSKATMTATVNGADVIDAKGQQRYKPDLAVDMTMSMNLQALVGASGQTSGAPQGMPTTIDMEMVLLNKKLYMKLPTQLSGSLGGDSASKPWLEIDPNSGGSLGQSFGSMIDMAQQNSDPSKFLDDLRDAGATINSSTPEQLNGQQTTHYSITVDTKKLLEHYMSGAQQQQLNGSLSSMPKTLPMDVWMNSDNLPVRVTMTVPAGGLTMKTRVDYTDWDQPVTITAPPA
ncbi:MAG: hypothetical protein J2O49_11850, partial [Sciscionella sp.]|nr:hypothetical protein [Sciscionella sp.]